MLEAALFFTFSTIKFVFERSDLGSNFFNRRYARRHKFNSPCIIFWQPNRAREKELIFCDGSNNVITFGGRQQNVPRSQA